MKFTRKRILSLCLSLALVFSLLGIPVKAEDGWDYNESTNTLTLTNYSSTNVENIDAGTAQIYSSGDLNLVLVGENNLSGEAGYGIYCEGNLTISGDGSLKMSNVGQGIFAKINIHMKSGSVSIPDAEITSLNGVDFTLDSGVLDSVGSIKTKEGNITIKSGEVKAKSLISSIDLSISNAEIDARLEGKKISIDKSKVIAESVEEVAHGIDASSVTIKDSNVVASTDQHSLNGIYGDCTIDNSTVHVTGSWEGISGDVTMNSGELTSIADAGIGIEGKLAMNGGTVVATGTSTGISGTLLMNNGKVVATGGTGYGISTGKITVNAGEVTASGGTQALTSSCNLILADGVEFATGSKESSSRYAEAYYGEKYIYISSLGNISHETQGANVIIDNELLTESVETEQYTFDKKSNTLFLKGYANSKVSNYEDGTAFIYSDGDLNLVLEGENTLSGDADYGIMCEGNLFIRGDGTLVIGNATEGIYAKINVNILSGNLKITDSDKAISNGIDLIIESGVIEASSGIANKNGNIQIKGGDVKAKSIVSSNELLINNANIDARLDGKKIDIADSTVVAESVGEIAHGIDASSITIKDSNVVASTDQRSLNGIYGNCTIDNSTVHVTGSWEGISGNVTMNSGELTSIADAGIGIEGMLTMNGGTVTATGTSTGISGTLLMNNGKVVATGGTGCGISAGKITVNAGEVTASGGTQAFTSSCKLILAEGVEFATGSKESTAKYADEYYGEKYVHISSLGDIDHSISGAEIILNNERLTESVETDTYIFDKDTYTLTLKNFSNNSVSDSEDGTALIHANNHLNLILEGENVLSGESNYGIYCDGNLLISGSGSLKIQGAATGVTAKIGICMNAGEITVKDSDICMICGADFVLEAGKIDANAHIKTKLGNINIYGGNVVARGIVANKDLFIEDAVVDARLEGKKLTINDSDIRAASVGEIAHGIQASTVTIKGSKVFASTDQHSLTGISGNCTIEDSDVQAIGSWEGIYGNVTMNSGELSVTAEAGQGIRGTVTLNDGTAIITGTGSGIYGSLYINGGKLIATGESGCGVTGSKIEINGGELEVYGKTQALKSSNTLNVIVNKCSGMKTGISKEYAKSADSYYAEEYVEVTADHKWDDGIQLTFATCKEKGTIKYTCSECQITKTELTQYAEHSWNINTTIDRDATCITEGSESIHCSVCDKKDASTIQVIPMIDHAMGQWKVILKPTTEEDGLRERKCTTCGYKESEVLEKLEYTSGDVNGDATVDTSDAQATFNHFMGISIIEDEQLLRTADVNFDGNIDTSDAQMIFNMFMGII